MNTVFFIGGLMGLSNLLKPSVNVLENVPDSFTLDQLNNYLLEKCDQGEITTSSTLVFDVPDSFTLNQLKEYLFKMFDQGQITTSSTLVFDVSRKKDSEVLLFLKNIIPEAKDKFKNSWNTFQKSIVLLLPKQPTIKLNNLLTTNGLVSFVRTEDIEDYLDVRGLVQ